MTAFVRAVTAWRMASKAGPGDAVVIAVGWSVEDQDEDARVDPEVGGEACEGGVRVPSIGQVADVSNDRVLRKEALATSGGVGQSGWSVNGRLDGQDKGCEGRRKGVAAAFDKIGNGRWNQQVDLHRLTSLSPWE